ncbi:MAG: hypothetical protein Q9168_004587 [Polycauliona sp. 1 TL-2023]
MRRNGALKMGGTYWYYYRLNDEVEHHDPVQPSTTACPLLPGQEVNILEVPSETQGRPRNIWETDVFTLDPSAKYSPRKPSVRPKPTPIPSGTPCADSASELPALERQKARVEPSVPPSTATLQPSDDETPKAGQALCIALPSSSTLKAKILKLRGSKSASEVDGKMAAPRRGPFKSFWRRSTEDEERGQCHRQIPTTPINTQQEDTTKDSRRSSSRSPLAAARTTYVEPRAADSMSDQVLANRPSYITASQSTMRSNLHSASHMLYEGVLHDTLRRRSSTRSKSSSPSAYRASLDDAPFGENHLGAPAMASPAAAPVDVASLSQREESYEYNPPRPKDCIEAESRSTCADSPCVLPIQTNLQPAGLQEEETLRPRPVAGIVRSARPPSLLHDNRHTLEPLRLASPIIDGQLSPHYLSLQETPSLLDDFDEALETASQSHNASYYTPLDSPQILPRNASRGEFESLPMPQLPGAGFQGYSLPEPQRTSTLTLQKLPSNNLSASHLRPSSSETQRFVESWDDGSGQRHLTALDELVYDLGHLGRIIT